MKRLGLVLAVLVFAAAAVFANGSKDGAAGGKVVMGALIRNLKKMAAENKVELKLLDGNSDVATQLDQLNALLTQGVKYFVIIPQDTGATEQMAKAIEAKGGAAAFSNIQPSVASLKVGKNFFLASSPESLKARGYKVTMVAEDTANWGAAEAQQKMDAWIAAHKNKFNVVIAQNDDMALGAIESMLTNKYTDDPNDVTKDTNGDGTVLKVPVIGVDGTETGVRSMNENKMYATVLQDSIGQSTTAFELVYQVAANGSAIGYTTKAGLSAAKAVTGEDPVTDKTILDQCFLVPFKPIVK